MRATRLSEEDAGDPILARPPAVALGSLCAVLFYTAGNFKLVSNLPRVMDPGRTWAPLVFPETLLLGGTLVGVVALWGRLPGLPADRLFRVSLGLHWAGLVVAAALNEIHGAYLLRVVVLQDAAPSGASSTSGGAWWPSSRRRPGCDGEGDVIRAGAAFIVATTLSWHLTPIASRAAIALGILDRPAGRLKNHAAPVPYLGGLAIYLSFLLALVSIMKVGRMPGVVVGGTLAVLVGLLDDLGHGP